MSDCFRQCKMCDDLKLDKEFSFMEMVCRECYWRKVMPLGCQEPKNNEKCEHYNPGAETDSDSGPNSPSPTVLSDRAKSPASLVTPVLTGRLSPHHSPVFCSNEMCRVKILAGKTRHPKTGMKWICQICRAYFMTYQKDRVTREFQGMLDLVVKALASPIFKLPPLPQNSRWTWSEWKNILQKTFPGDFFTKQIVEHRQRNGFNDVPVFEDPDDGAGPAPRMLNPIIVPSEVRATPPPLNSYCAATVTGSSAIPEKPDVLERVPAPQAPLQSQSSRRIAPAPGNPESREEPVVVEVHQVSVPSSAPKASAVPKKPIVYKNAPVFPSGPAPVDGEPPPQALSLKPGPNLAPDKPTPLVGPFQLPAQASLSLAVKSIFPVEYQPTRGPSKSLLSSTSTSIELEDCQESPLDLSLSSAPKNASQAPAPQQLSTAASSKPAESKAASQAIMNPNAVSVIRFAPKSTDLFIRPAPKCSEPVNTSAPKPLKHFIGPSPKPSHSSIEHAPESIGPFIGPAPKSPKPFIKTTPKSSEPAPKLFEPFIGTASKSSKIITDPASNSTEPFIGSSPKSSRPFIEPAPKPSKHINESAPKYSKPFIEPAPKSTDPFIRPAPKSSKPFTKPAPEPSRPHAPAIPSTSVSGTSATTATINRIQTLVTSIEPPPPPPETLIVPKIYSQIFHVCGNDGICMRPMARRVFVDMETGKKVCYSCIRRKPRSSRQLPVAAKKTRMEEDAKT